MEHTDQTREAPGESPGNRNPANSSPLDGLQFQRAEISERSCVPCSAAIVGEYFQLNGADLCSSCAGQWRDHQREPDGGRVTRGAIYGMGAALAGALLMGVVSYVTGYQLALISIAVGWMVGKAFRKGTGGATSKRCQRIAVALAYFGITMSFIPDIFGASDPKRAEIAGQARSESQAKGDTAVAPGAGASPEAGKSEEPMTAGGFVLGVAVIVGVALLSPFLLLFGGFAGIINVAIVFFGLQQAWRLMAPDPSVLEGPITLTPGGAAAA